MSEQDTSLIPEQEPDETLPEKRGVGKPRKYTPRQLQNAIDKYFEPFGSALVKEQSGEIRVPTICGLANSLGVVRQTLLVWAAEKDGEYCDIARNAINKLASYFEELAVVGKSPSGAAFWLRNHGWDGDKVANKTEVSANDGQGKELKVIIREVKDVPFNPEGGQ